MQTTMTADAAFRRRKTTIASLHSRAELIGFLSAAQELGQAQLPESWRLWSEDALRHLTEAVICELGAKTGEVDPAIADFIDPRFPS